MWWMDGKSCVSVCDSSVLDTGMLWLDLGMFWLNLGLNLGMLRLNLWNVVNFRELTVA
jgi:hypothetical protein